MASKPCSRCDSRIRGKSAALYWAFFPEPQKRLSILTRLCPPCTADVLVPLITRPTEDRDLCPGCGSNPDAPVQTVYLSAFIPQREQYDDEWPMCPSCRPFLWDNVTRGGETQPDREVGVRGPSPSSTAWAAIPIPV